MRKRDILAVRERLQQIIDQPDGLRRGEAVRAMIEAKLAIESAIESAERARTALALEVDFKPPDRAQVDRYFDQLGMPEQSEIWYTHFQSNGWKVGGRSKMRDWQASAKNWVARERLKHNGRSSTRRSATNGLTAHDVQRTGNTARQILDHLGLHD